MYTRDLLRTKSIDELRAILVSKGIDWHPRHKADTLIDMIANLEFTVQPNDKGKEKAQEKKVVEIKKLTEDEITEAVQEFIDNRGLRVKVDEDCWYFRCKGREDSGNLKMPLETVKRIAAHVSRGGYAPPVVDFDGEKVLG